MQPGLLKAGPQDFSLVGPGAFSAFRNVSLDVRKNWFGLQDQYRKFHNGTRPGGFLFGDSWGLL